VIPIFGARFPSAVEATVNDGVAIAAKRHGSRGWFTFTDPVSQDIDIGRKLPMCAIR
jgi:hypothetical protein